ncbi:MAG: sensor histidine kinase [Acidimicrobiia bacterium]
MRMPSVVKRLVRWVRGLSPMVQDGALALVMAITSVASLIDVSTGERTPDALTYLAAVVGMGALAWRRVNPLAAFVVATVAIVTVSGRGHGEAGLPFALVLLFYAVAAHARRRTRVLAFLVLGAAFVALLATSETSNFKRGDVVANGFLFSIVWIVGENVRSRRERLAAAEERAAYLEQERHADARQAVSSERLRIAQELHDVVAHAMSVIAVQSGMGAHVIDTQPEEAKKALQAIETTSRSALDELRRMLGVLREEGDRGGSLAPAPLAGDVEALIDTVRQAGVPVELRWTGLTADVMPPDSVLLNRYRILQEALTNVLKHAGPASAIVTIVECVGETTIEVVDDGRGLAATVKPPDAPTGHGLVGMRERVALFGGSLEAGARPGGGFRVFARLGWDDVTDSRSGPLVERVR